MTPKEKAEQLTNKFLNLPSCESVESAKHVAFICANETLNSHSMYTGNLNPKWKYWNEVIEHIDKL